MTLRSLVLASLLLVGATAPAQAGGVALFTPLAEAGSGNLLRCIALNTGKKAIAPVVVAFLDASGVLVTGATCPNVARGQACTAGIGGPRLGYCEITYNRSKKVVRGALMMTDANGNTVLNLEAR
jgi:hypothetical protein